jgi:two-component system, LuxR family, response regulator FixJ
LLEHKSPVGRTLYLVDDDPAFLAALSRFLRAAGYTTEAFSSPTEFLKKLPSVKGGCLILDLQMPGLSGFDVQDAVAKHGNPLPIIFLTGQGDVPDAVRAMRHGAEDFLVKHGSDADLLGAIERALARNARELSERQQ